MHCMYYVGQVTGKMQLRLYHRDDAIYMCLDVIAKASTSALSYTWYGLETAHSIIINDGVKSHLVLDSSQVSRVSCAMPNHAYGQAGVNDKVIVLERVGCCW